MFCAQCGGQIVGGARFCGRCGAPALAGGAPAPSQQRPGPQRPQASQSTNGKGEILRAVEAALSAFPEVSVTRSGQSDLEVRCVLADAKWVIGKKKVDYLGSLRVIEWERTVMYFERVKESGMGLPPMFSFKAETYRTDGKTISGNVREAGWGPGGKVLDYKWDYGQIREAIRQAVEAWGWKFSATLLKGRTEMGGRVGGSGLDTSGSD